MQALISGAASGFLSTGPMTLAMFAMQESLPARERSPLPPATLTHDLAKVSGVAPLTRPGSRVVLTLANHFGYGTAMGGLYSQTLARLPGPGFVKGAIFGLGVWAGSYLGWTPATGFRAAATRMPARRNAMMIAAHLVWGSCLGWGEAVLRRSGEEMLDGARKAPAAE